MRTLFVLSFYTYSRVAQGCDGSNRRSKHRDNANVEKRDVDDGGDAKSVVDPKRDDVKGGSFADLLGKLRCASTHDDMIKRLNPSRSNPGSIKPTLPDVDDLELFTNHKDFKEFTFNDVKLHDLQKYMTLSRILPGAEPAGKREKRTNCTAGSWYYVPEEPPTIPTGNPTAEALAKAKAELATWKEEKKATLTKVLHNITRYHEDFVNPAETLAVKPDILPELTSNLVYCIRTRGASKASIGDDFLSFADYVDWKKPDETQLHNRCRVATNQKTNNDEVDKLDVKCRHQRVQDLLTDDKGVFDNLMKRFGILYDGEIERIRNDTPPYIVNGGEAVGVEVEPVNRWRNRLLGCLVDYVFPAFGDGDRHCVCPKDYATKVLKVFGQEPLQKKKGDRFFSLFNCSKQRSEHYLMNHHGRKCLLEAKYLSV
jgi:hypothetical protein